MFNFSSNADEQTFISLRGLVKNNGFFKSEKQQKFMLKTYKDSMTDLKFLGVKLCETDVTYVTISAYYQWADYGSRSIVPTIITFVLDEFGVRAQYKTGGFGNLREGWSPDPTKCKTIWERDESIEKPVFNQPKEQVGTSDEPKSVWLGQVGDRLTITGVITFAKCIGASQWGAKWITVLKDDNGNQIKAWKYLGEKGDTVTIKGTVKEHGDYNGALDTTLTRISILNVVQAGKIQGTA